MPRIGVEAIESRFERGDEHDVLADEPVQQTLGVPDDLVEVQYLWLQDLPAAEGEKLSRERCRTLAGAAHVLDIGARGMARLEFLEHEVAVAEDRRQQVVEVVRDAAGQAADRLHFARLHQLVLELPTVFLHFGAGLQVLEQPLLRAGNLLAHRVEGARQPSDLVAAVARNALPVVALRDALGGVGQFDQRPSDLRRDERDKDDRDPDDDAADHENPRTERGSGRHHERARKLHPDAPGRAWDDAHGADTFGTVAPCDDVASGVGDTDGGWGHQSREIGPPQVADSADKDASAVADEAVEDVGRRRQRDGSPQHQHAGRCSGHGRIAHRLHALRHDRAANLVQPERALEARRRAGGKATGGEVTGNGDAPSLARPECQRLTVTADKRGHAGAHDDVGLLVRVADVPHDVRIVGEVSELSQPALGGIGQQRRQLIGGRLGPLGAGGDKCLFDLVGRRPDKQRQHARDERGDQQWKAPPQRVSSRRGSIAVLPQRKQAHKS